MPPAGTRPDSTKKLFLVIDEDPSIATIIKQALPDKNHEVLSETNLENGLKTAKLKRPTLIFADTTFTDGTGADLLERIANTPEIRSFRVCFITHDDTLSSRLYAIQHGAVDYIVKPLDPDQISERLNKIFIRLRKILPTSVRGSSVEKLRDLVQNIEDNALSGLVDFSRPSQTARIVFAFGEVRDAMHGLLHREEALNEIAAYGQWKIEFTEGASSTYGEDFNDQLLANTPVEANRLLDAQSNSPLASRAGGLKNASALRPEALIDNGTSHDLAETDIETKTGSPPAMMQNDKRAKARHEDAANNTPHDLEMLANTDFPEADPELLEYDEEIPTSMSFANPQDFFDEVDSPQKANASSLNENYDPPTVDQIPNPQAKQSAVQAAANALMSGASQPAVKPLSPSRKLPRLDPSTFDDIPLRSDSLDTVRPTSASAFPGSGTDATILREWLSNANKSPLILLVNDSRISSALQLALKELGIIFLTLDYLGEAYLSTLRLKPLAVICELHGQKSDGLELLRAIRSDFSIGDVPVIMLPTDQILKQIDVSGSQAITPIISGLRQALIPKAKLYFNLSSSDPLPINGTVESVGLYFLLHTLGETHCSGRLQLAAEDKRMAELVIQNGELCGATVTAGDPSVGQLALLHLVSQQWREYSFVPDTQPNSSLIPLGELNVMLNAAQEQANLLLLSIYRHGFNQAELRWEKSAQPFISAHLPSSINDLIPRLQAGETPHALVEQKFCSPSQMRLLIAHLLLHSSISATSLRAIKLDVRHFPSSGAPMDYKRSVHSPRWGVVALAGTATFLIGSCGYWLYHYLA